MFLSSSSPSSFFPSFFVIALTVLFSFVLTPISAEVISEIACENSIISVDCGSSNLIKIRDANYGRTDSETCSMEGNAGASKNTACFSTSTFDDVKDSCHGTQSCEMTASNSNFGETCPGTAKYLNVTYECVPDWPICAHCAKKVSISKNPQLSSVNFLTFESNQLTASNSSSFEMLDNNAKLAINVPCSVNPFWSYLCSNCVQKPSTYSYLGEGECRQSDGSYPIKFSKDYFDLNPHTSGTNAQQALDRCKAKCIEFTWCLAAEVVLRDVWPSPKCRLVTDWNAYVVESTNTFQNNQWGGTQSIDGENYQTYCNGGSSPCNSSNVFDGGKINSRDGYHCYLQTAT